MYYIPTIENDETAKIKNVMFMVELVRTTLEA